MRGGDYILWLTQASGSISSVPGIGCWTRTSCMILSLVTIPITWQFSSTTGMWEKSLLIMHSEACFIGVFSWMVGNHVPDEYLREKFATM